MAPKTLYDAGEVQKKVTETALKALTALEEEGWEFSESIAITCDYLGAATSDGYALDKRQRYVAQSVSSDLTATKAQTRILPRGFVTTIT